jgi:hypothetical protein
MTFHICVRNVNKSGLGFRVDMEKKRFRVYVEEVVWA